MNPRKPYEVMKSAVDKKFMPTLEEIQKINSFFLIRFISNDPNSIYIANALNCNYSIPIEAQYNFVRNSTLDKVAFINYPKKNKDFSNKEIEILKKHFKINDSLAKDYAKVLGKEKVEELVKRYDFGKF